LKNRDIRSQKDLTLAWLLLVPLIISRFFAAAPGNIDAGSDHRHDATGCDWRPEWF